jgi:hypothetical protein
LKILSINFFRQNFKIFKNPALQISAAAAAAGGSAADFQLHLGVCHRPRFAWKNSKLTRDIPKCAQVRVFVFFFHTKGAIRLNFYFTILNRSAHESRDLGAPFEPYSLKNRHRVPSAGSARESDQF